MKKCLLALFCAVFAIVTVSAQTRPARPGAPGKTAPGQKAGETEEPVIEGTVLNRPDGTFLGLTLHEGKYKLAFYDAEKKPMPVNVLRAVARWPNMHGPGQNRAVLNPAGDGTFLLGNQFVRGPHAFKLIIVLITTEAGDSTESYTVDFRG